MFFNLSSVVLLGNFNPSIFHPEWFNRYKILPIQETQWSEGEQPKTTIMEHDGRKIILKEVPPLIVKSDLADLYFPSLRVIVTSEKYECTTQKRVNFSQTQDVTAKIFRILQHTPVKALGINFHGHCTFDKNTNVILHDMFAGKDHLMRATLGGEYEISGNIVWQDNDQKYTITLDKSMLMENAVHCGVNIHRDITTGQAGDAVELLTKNYKSDLEKVISILKKLLGDPKELWEPKESK